MKTFFKKIASLRGGIPTGQSIIIFVVFILAFLLRVYGLNWDQNYHLHPDERFLTMVTNDIKIPTSVSNYFDTNHSSLNPYNYPQYQFFVYGTFPIFLVKFLAVQLHLDDYNNITLLGRVVSAIFDSGNVILLYFLSRKILKKIYVFIPSILYAILVFPLQLSHFYTVDTFLSFFILFTFILMAYNLFIPAAFTFALALSCKVSALYFVPIIFLFLLKKYFTTRKKIYPLFLLILCCSIVTFIIFRIFQPYAFDGIFNINPKFINSLETLSSFSNSEVNYPPAIQWINRPLIIDSLINHLLWGLGPMISFPMLFLLLKILLKIKIKFNLILIMSIWILFLFTYQSVQFAHTMRYYLPIYSFISIVFVVLLSQFKVKTKYILLIIFLNILYAISYLSIYSRPNSRVQASSWMLKNIPNSEIISSEYWDDALPLGYSPYKNISLALFDFDNFEKWSKINYSLNQIDYLIMSSNRLWASIPRVPDRYPLASKFYIDLFSNNTEFFLTKKFVSYPGFPLSFLKSCFYLGPSNYPGDKNNWFEKDDDCLYPGIYLRDDTAEEAFSVYDHPQVLIFQKSK